MASKRQKERRYGSAKRRIERREKTYAPTTFTLPEGVELFKFKEAKTYRLEVVCFVAGKGNPNADEGELYFERTFYQHPRIGAEEKTYCCPKETFKHKSCECCRRSYLAHKKGNKEEAKNWRAKERQLWLVLDLDDKEKGVQLFECGYWGGPKTKGFGQEIDAQIEAADDDSPKTCFWHGGKDGMTLRVRTKKDSFEGNVHYPVTNIEFVPRKVSVDFDPDEMPCLDDLLIETSPEEIAKILTAEPVVPDDEDGDDDEKPQPPSRKAPKGKKVEEDDEDDEDDDEEVDTAEEDDEPEDEDDDAEDDEEDEGDEEEDEDEDEDEDDDPDDEDMEDDDVDDEDDPPVKKKGPAAKAPVKKPPVKKGRP